MCLELEPGEMGTGLKLKSGDSSFVIGIGASRPQIKPGLSVYVNVQCSHV